MRDDLPAGRVTLFFSDIEGSTKLLHELGPAAYADVLAEHRHILREAFARHEGLVISTVSLASYMERLFGAKISAWHEAQKKGQSFGAHLAGTVEIRMDEVAFLDDADVVEEVAEGSRPDTPRFSEDMTAAATPTSKGQTGFFKKHRALVAVIGACVMIGVAVGVVRGLRTTDDDVTVTPLEHKPEPTVRASEPAKHEPPAKPEEPAAPAIEVPKKVPASDAKPSQPAKKPALRPVVKKPEPKPEPCPEGTERIASGKCVSKKTKPW